MTRRRVRLALPFLASTAIVIAMVALASAVRVPHPDPNDTPGVLDVRLVRFEQPQRRAPEWTVLTFARWSSRQLWDAGYVHVEIDALGHERVDHYVVIRSVGSSMTGTLFRVASDPTKPDRAVTDVYTWRPRKDAVSVRIPLRKITFGPHRTFYRWWVLTSLTSSKCVRTCFDRVPDEGNVLQWRPGMSPSPTPSPSPSPSPSPTPTESPTPLG